MERQPDVPSGMERHYDYDYDDHDNDDDEKDVRFICRMHQKCTKTELLMGTVLCDLQDTRQLPYH